MNGLMNTPDDTESVRDLPESEPTLPPVMIGEDGSTDDGQSIDLDWLLSFTRLLRNYYRLYGVVLAATVVLYVGYFALAGPTYTAVAVLGPPGPSPTGSLIASVGLGSGFAGKLLGAGGTSGVEDPYQDFLQLLPSTRLCEGLVRHSDVAQTIFYQRWDAEKKQWKKPGPLHAVAGAVKSLFFRPSSDHPGVDELGAYLKSSLSVTRSERSVQSGGLLTAGTPYIEVSFKFEDPEQAQKILTAILAEADQIIRDDQRHDVTARIDYLKQELTRQTIATDERTALISILSDQEQLLSMIQADQRYASSLIVTPYASPKPTSPPGPALSVIIVAVMAAFAWAGLVFAGLRSPRVARLIARFRRKTPR